MPSKKKKYNARFPAGRIKKIMQSDEEVGKVAQAVPVIISRTLELFVESLLTKTLKITYSRNAKTLSPSHMKQCIMSEQRFDFLRELVKNIPDISVAEEAANYNEEDNHSSPEYPDSDTPYDLSMPSTSLRAGRQQSVPSNGHNGGGQHTQQIQQQHHDYQRNYLKRSFSSNPSSVIRHTTTALSHSNADYPPAKLPRSDLMPQPVPQQLTGHQHHRLKHQPYSFPSHLDNNNYKPNMLGAHPKQTAIPPPIVNIDYCSKPVVKIDYSNLSLSGVPTVNNVVAAPLSAPANIASMSGNNSAFNFSAEPVISIDLSNIVNSSATAVPSMATISIGTQSLPPPPIPSAITNFYSPAPVNKTKSSSTKNAYADQSRNSKASVADAINSSSVTAKATALAAAVAAATTITTVKSTIKNDSYLEMDEDYDNI